MVAFLPWGDYPKPKVKLPMKRRMRDVLGRFGINRVQLSAQKIIADAELYSGLNDWGDQDYRQCLDKFLESIERESDIPEGAREFCHFYLTMMGIGRLQTMATLKNNPEIEEIPIESPIFIAGLQRTGSTVLQGMLSADPGKRSMLFWETEAMSPPPTPENATTDPRIRMCEQRMAHFYSVAPDFRAIHHTDTMEPDECNAFFARNFSTAQMTAYFHVPSFEAWHFERDFEAAYRFHKQQLQILSWKFPKQRWVCKSPEHNLHLDALLKVYPDARVIVSHRAPAQVMGSSCSMVRYLRYIFSHGAYAKRKVIGAHQLNYISNNLKRSMECRRRLPEENFLDIAYSSLVKSPHEQMEQIYRFLGETYTAERRAAIETYLTNNRQHKHGGHKYTLAEFGLSEAIVEDATRDYQNMFAHLLQPA